MALKKGMMTNVRHALLAVALLVILVFLLIHFLKDRYVFPQNITQIEDKEFTPFGDETCVDLMEQDLLYGSSDAAKAGCKTQGKQVGPQIECWDSDMWTCQ